MSLIMLNLLKQDMYISGSSQINNRTIIWAAEIFLVESIGVRTVAVCIGPNLNHRPVLRMILRLPKRQPLLLASKINYQTRIIIIIFIWFITHKKSLTKVKNRKCIYVTCRWKNEQLYIAVSRHCISFLRDCNTAVKMANYNATSRLHSSHPLMSLPKESRYKIIA